MSVWGWRQYITFLLRLIVIKLRAILMFSLHQDGFCQEKFSDVAVDLGDSTHAGSQRTLSRQQLHGKRGTASRAPLTPAQTEARSNYRFPA